MIPNKVVINGITYTIQEVVDLDESKTDEEIAELDNPEEEKTGTLVGMCSARKQTIEYDSSLLPDGMRQTVTHELTHAISNEYGFEMDEAGVKQFSAALFATMYYNPDLFRWILEVNCNAN